MCNDNLIIDIEFYKKSREIKRMIFECRTHISNIKDIKKEVTEM